MGREEDLKLRIDVVGAEKSAKDVAKVAQAQKKLTDQGKPAAQAAKDQAAATRDLSGSEADLVSILSQVSPQLAGLVDGMLKASKVAGDFASKEISLTGVVGFATEAIKGNANALKFFAAAGAVVFGISQIISAVQKLREEHEKATQAAKDQRNALNELLGTQREAQEDIEKLSLNRREGPLSAEESAAILKRLNATRAVSPGVDEGSLRASALLRGGEASNEDIRSLAIALEKMPEKFAELLAASPEARGRGIERLERREADTIRAVVEREATQVAEKQAQAQREQRAGVVGSTIDIKAIAAKELSGESADLDRIAEIVKALPEAVKRVVAAGVPITLSGGVDREGLKRSIEREIAIILQGDDTFSRLVNALPGSGFFTPVPLEVAQAQRVLTRVDPELARQTAHLEAVAIAGKGGSTDALVAEFRSLREAILSRTGTTNHFNQRVTGTNQGTVRNGQSHRELNSPEG